MTLAEYEVLLHLSEASDHRLRMNELADLARLSPSGLTRTFRCVGPARPGRS